jgi:RNA polymerase sporulation-specific sigma factor
VDWDGNELLLSDILGSDQNAVNMNIEEEVERDLLRSAVSRLAPREKKIMQLRFGLNNQREHTQKEVADTLGISQSYISRLEKRIIERLRKDLERVS